jgi:DNA-binding CsgD family transcriptional regulator
MSRLLDTDAETLAGALRVITSAAIGDDRWAPACANELQSLLAADRVAAVMHRRHRRVADGSAAQLIRTLPFNTAGDDALPSPGVRTWTIGAGVGRPEAGDRQALGVTVTLGESAAFSIVLVYDCVFAADDLQRARAILEIVEPVLAAVASTRIPFDRADRTSGQTNRVSSPLAAEQIKTLRTRYRLTRRELDVTRLLARGKSNKEIADRLSISAHTARHHTERVLGKIGVRTRAAIASVLSSLGI